ncbi:hypothetical protein GYMLUDRAFT_259312 [Collybiopsis luxurians FD-317 M1]|uniref:Unplaced genomic scaffold GYMLUscaffold_15, whole genome shotgun sequence n=1 Tax=Collybiopsis luxurians FD-317 M1 TaxID=944289 RepID=A0A0D0CVB7_9AGAR|nr:hypothetical protein GYMLUDRAFT_259312 [Collybiopsis luxurians FD-317 M1]
MSARTPFIPSNPRPDSRIAHAKDDSVASASKEAQFPPDFGNPLHGDMHKLPSLQLSSNKNAVSVENESSSSSNNTHKPLNLNGLFKKPTPGSGLNLSGRRSNSIQLEKSNSANDPSTLSTPAKGRSIRRDQASTPSVLAPKPVNAVSASELLSSNSFKAPSLPASSVTSLHVASEAHIPITDEENPHPPHQYKFGNAPPQRVLLNDDSNTRPLSMAGFMPKHAHRDRDRASKKRGRADLEPDDDIRDPEMMYSVKRYKATDAPVPIGMDSEYMEEDIDCPRPPFSPQPVSSPIERAASRQSRHGTLDHYQPHTSSSGYHPSPTQGFQPHQHQQSLQRMLDDPVTRSGNGGDRHNRMSTGPPSLSNGSNASVEGVRGSDALDKLLGCQADIYVEDHIEKYEKLTAKWRDCPMDEWRKGADEIMAKYMKIMDFVKEHMSTKLKLFASFDEKVEAHNIVLGERAKVLDGAKAKLVSQGGNLIG